MSSSIPVSSSTSRTKRFLLSACCPSRTSSRVACAPSWGACMTRDFFSGRHAGLLVPLFSIPSRESWGIGEIPDIIRIGCWMREAGFSFLQLLPLNEMAEGQNSPYSALSAMAIDPLFIAPSRVPDVEALGGERALSDEERSRLDAARSAPAIQYPAVRAVKNRIFRAAFDRFMTDEWSVHSHRAARLT